MKTLPVVCLLFVLSVPRGTVVGQPVVPAQLPHGEAVVHDIRPGPGVTATRRLSDYLPSLAGTAGDTAVFVLEGRRPGGTMFVAGGTHASELAGTVVATVLVERARVDAGRLIVIPHANNSAASYRDASNPESSLITIPSASGDRTFRYGSRLTNASHQGQPDPPKFRHPSSTTDLAGEEARNLDRAYPGKADGNLTQQIAFAILEVLKRERVDLAFDLHESRPESPLAWTIVANPKNADVGAMAVLALDAAGIPMKLDASSESFRGLSHREWGDATRAQAFLFETPNPAQAEGAKRGDPANDPTFPLARRVGTQLSALAAVVDAYDAEALPALVITLADVPTLEQVMKVGVGGVLR